MLLLPAAAAASRCLLQPRPRAAPSRAARTCGRVGRGDARRRQLRRPQLRQLPRVRLLRQHAQPRLRQARHHAQQRRELLRLLALGAHRQLELSASRLLRRLSQRLQQRRCRWDVGAAAGWWRRWQQQGQVEL